MNSIKMVSIAIVALAVLATCATPGPSVLRVNDVANARDQIAIVKLNQRMSFTVVGCDGVGVPRSVRYLLLQPGRHELFFNVAGNTPIVMYSMNSRKYLDAVAGHTYVLKSETGWLSIGDKWFPEVVDVTNDPQEHVNDIPVEQAQAE